MPHFCLIVLALLLRSQISFAQTHYKDEDTSKYSKNEIITNANGFKTIVYYKGNAIGKIKREFIGTTYSSITIHYIKDDQLLHSVYVSLRKPNVYFEEHTYFSNGKMIKWVNTKDKEVSPALPVYSEKEKLALNFFTADLKEAKTKKPVR